MPLKKLGLKKTLIIVRLHIFFVRPIKILWMKSCFIFFIRPIIFNKICLAGPNYSHREQLKNTYVHEQKFSKKDPIYSYELTQKP